MRALPLLVLLAVPTAAHADNFVEIAGGIMIPVEDDDWTDYVESGPKLAGRIGSTGSGALGGLISVDWTPLNTEDTGFGNAVEISAHRFRILGNLSTTQVVGKNLSASVRLGAGFDITHVTVDSNIFGVRSESSDTDSGLAVEAAAGLWFKAGSMMIGGEIALPLSFQDDGDNDDDEDVDLVDYASLDFDILFGVRFMLR